MDKTALKTFIKDLLIAAVIVFIISIFIKPTIVNGISMMPTLTDEDYLVVNKMAYIHKDHPEYGDIIVFKTKGNLAGYSHKLLIKRVIGVEGDKIVVRDGQVYRNGELLDEPYIHGVITEGEVECTVPQDEVFVLGDNRPCSYDSRKEMVGTVSEDSILGKATFRLFPFNQICRF